MDAMGAVDPLLREIFDEHIATLERARDGLLGDVTDLASDLGDALERGGKLVVFGNGGSAADSQHFAAELVGRFNRPREPLPAMALTTDTSALTAIGNDFDYGEVFARQVRAHVREGDIIVAVGNTEVSSVKEFDTVVAKVDKSKPIPVLLRRGELATYLLIRPAH